ncbi:hypothetical protein ACHHYP_16759 [Achlya hypogyna]|uniref:Uncharacterized protein n=1 Tax=Achlya hypogyna TaxID=1202772 RepID=A0A1V9Y5V9_ACHHY|nr:hypothetical protein ACHHYP_16759 [Achlya hypogyna]
MLPYYLNQPQIRSVRFDVALQERVHNAAFWTQIETVSGLLHSVCAALGYLEGDEATHSSHVLARFGSIYCPTHALAFITDPLFFDMRQRLVHRFGAAFVQLGQGSVRDQCLAALDLLGRDDQARATLRGEFTEWMASDGGTMPSLTDCKQLKPGVIWSMVDDSSFSSLAPLLVQLYSTPAGAVAGERSHKTTKQVFAATRTRMIEDNLEHQVAVTFNGHELDRKLSVKREDKYTKLLAGLGSGDPNVALAQSEVSVSADEPLDDPAAGEFTLRRPSIDRLHYTTQV